MKVDEGQDIIVEVDTSEVSSTRPSAAADSSPNSAGSNRTVPSRTHHRLLHNWDTTRLYLVLDTADKLEGHE